MKKHQFIFLFIFGMNASSFAQWTTDSIVHPGDSVHQVYKQTMLEIFEHPSIPQGKR